MALFKKTTVFMIKCKHNDIFEAAAAIDMLLVKLAGCLPRSTSPLSVLRGLVW